MPPVFLSIVIPTYNEEALISDTLGQVAGFLRTREYTWEVPMGGSDAGEEPIDTARRELKEETGLTATTLTPLMRLHTSNSITDEEGSVFVARGLRAGDTEFDEVENLKIRKLPLSEAIDMVKRGEITDAISVAALLRIFADQH